MDLHPQISVSAADSSAVFLMVVKAHTGLSDSIAMNEGAEAPHPDG